MRAFLLLVCGVALGAPIAARAQTMVHRPPAPVGVAADLAALRSVSAVRVAGPAPVVDGRLDEPAWHTAPAADGFVQGWPDPGAPATLRTEARVLYDGAAIYVGMRMYDPAPDSIVAPLGRRDYGGSSDWAHVIIDSYHDRRTAFRFSVNPAGVRTDALHSDDGDNEDVVWDAVWEARAARDSLGWTAEFRIPLGQLRYSVAAGAAAAPTWGIEFERHIARRNERDWWAPQQLPNVPGFVSRFGELTGLADLPALRRIEVQPYTVGRLTREPGDPADPFYRRSAWSGAGGADLKAGVTPNLTLNATINPDFGQVEADPSVVNLSAYETFFTEQRPFFTEGANIFRFDMGAPSFAIRGTDFGRDQPLYSRRIGRPPQGGLPGDERYGDAPLATTILGAAKLSGKTSGGWSIGTLDAVTARETAPYRDTAGVARIAELEPLTNYGVVRVIRDFRKGQSAVGAILTATNRRLDDRRLDFLTSAAWVTGLDARHRFGGGNYEVSASVIASRVTGDTAAINRVQRAPAHYFQRPGAPHLTFDSTRTALGGVAGSLWFWNRGGGPWRFGVVGNVRSPGLEMNDLGYQGTSDWLIQGGFLGYRRDRPGRWFRQWSVYVSQWSGFSFGGERRALGGKVNGAVRLRNFWGLSWWGIVELPAYSTDFLRGGPLIYQPTYTDGGITAFSDSGKRAVGYLTVERSGVRQSGSSWWYVQPGVRLRPWSRLEVELASNAARVRYRNQYVATVSAADGPHYLVGRLAQTEVSTTLRASYAFSPDLSLQLYAQPFISAGAFDEFKEVRRPRAVAFDERFHTYSAAQIAYDSSAKRYRVDDDGDGVPEFAFARPDFNVKQFHSTLVLRWEYRPGSTIFVVWNSGRNGADPTGAFRLGSDARRLFGLPATNTFLVKASYWLNF